MIYQIYKEIGKEPPLSFEKVYYTPLFERYYYHACSFETFNDSYRIDGSDEECKKHLEMMLETGTKHHLGIDRLAFTDEGSASWTQLAHINDNDNFPWALKNSIQKAGYLSSPWDKNNTIDFEITPVSSVAEAEEIQRNYIPPGQRKGLFIKTEE